jgi:hypothetical protein
MKSIYEVARKLLSCGLEDWLASQEIAAVVTKMGGPTDFQENKLESFQVLDYLAHEGLVEFGDLDASLPGFSPWGLPIEEALERAKRGWSMFTKFPLSPDLFYLRLTPKGIFVAEEKNYTL